MGTLDPGRVLNTVFVFGALAVRVIAQQPSVPAPHRPIAPQLDPPKPWHSRAEPRAMVGGFWRTDANYKSRLYLKNHVQTSSLTVTPILYLSNGTQYTLPDIELEPSGTNVLDINEALRQQSIAPWSALTGYVEVRYSWPWDALCVTVSNIDVLHSELFNFNLRPEMPGASRSGGAQPIEALWWKQESNVTAFVALTNISSQSLTATVQMSDSASAIIAQHSTVILPHGTAVVRMSELESAAATYGGLTVTHTGLDGDIIVNGGLEDPHTGYSANIPFIQTPPLSNVSSETFAELGLMVGAASPMLSFPVGTVFTPYSLVRNSSDQPVVVAPTIWWMEGASPHSARPQSFVVAPSSTSRIDIIGMMKTSGIANFNGSINLVLSTTGPSSNLILAGGSVDRNNTYVFSVSAIAVRESVSKSLSYWSTGNGDDTMFTVWNPADEAQAFVLKLFFKGGTYLYPFNLAAKATTSFNVSEIAGAAPPDVNGNRVPATVHEGSAVLSGSQAENQHILAVMEAGTYNVQKATCGLHCVSCNGATEGWVDADPFFVPIGGTGQLTFTSQYNTGHQYNLTSIGTWASSSPSMAAVNAGLVTGKASASVTITAAYDSEPLYTSSVCSSGIISCPVDEGLSNDSPGTIYAAIPYKVLPIATQTNTPASCSSGQNGWLRIVTNQLQDQQGNPYTQAGIIMADFISFSSPNALGISGTLTGSQATYPGGIWTDNYSVCSTACPAPGGSVGALQSWTYNGIPLPHVNSVVYTCSAITIDGF